MTLLLWLPLAFARWPPPGFVGDVREAFGTPTLAEWKEGDDRSCALISPTERVILLQADGITLSMTEAHRSATDFDRAWRLVLADGTWTHATSAQVRLEKKGRRYVGAVTAHFDDHGERSVSFDFDLPPCAKVLLPEPVAP